MLALRIGLISQHVWLLAHSDKAKAALRQARQLAWEQEADRFEKHQLAHLSQQTHGSGVMNILNSLVGAGEAVGAIAAGSLHAAADEVTATLAHTHIQPGVRATPRRGSVLRGLRRHASVT
jgi:hypothetical protein